MHEITEAIQGFSQAWMIPTGLVGIVGLLLWCAGRRVLNAGMATIGFVVGGAAGWAITEALGNPFEPWIGALVLGALLAFIAGYVTRLMISLAVAGVLAVAAPLAVATIRQIDINSPAAATAEAPEPSADMPALGLDIALPEGSEEVIAEAQQVVRRIVEGIRQRYDAVPESDRPLVAGAAAAGFLAGIFLGAAVPTVGTIVVTSFGGSLLWLTCAQLLLTGTGEPSDGAWQPGASVALFTWCGVAVIGMLIQWRWRPTKADDPG